MASHVVVIHDLQAKDGTTYQAVCTCRQRSMICQFQWEADDWKLYHLNLVGRVRIHLAHGKSPSLSSQRDYYRAMEKDLNTPAPDRVLWKQLADELDRRLNDTQPSKLEGLW